jgi:hypothetical protein
MSTARTLAALLLAAGAVVLGGCGADEAGTSAAHGARLDVVATTTQAADFARNVGGSRIDVHQILAPNADPHDYEVRPDDVRALAGADVVIRSGGDVDAWLDDAIGASGTDAPVVTLIDHVPEIHDGAALDPHWWQDPRNAERAVAVIRDALRRLPLRRGRVHAQARPARCRGRALLREGPGCQAQARHDARRARLLRAPLRHRGDRRRDPVALHAGPGLGGRDG